MPGTYRYNLYDADGRIIKADITKKELADIIGVSADTILRHLLGIVSGQKESYRGYTIECVLGRTPVIPYKATKELLEAEWDKTCKPFRALRRNEDADDKRRDHQGIFKQQGQAQADQHTGTTQRLRWFTDQGDT